jgi:hypothetical protein
MKYYTKNLEKEIQGKFRIPVSWFDIGFRRYHFTRILNIYFNWFKKRMLRGDVIGFRYFYLAMEDKENPLKEDLSSKNMKWSSVRAMINTKRRNGQFPKWDPENPYNYKEFTVKWDDELFQKLYYDKFMKKVNGDE